MNRSLYAALTAAAVIALSHGMTSYAQPGPNAQKREPIYGYRMMTDEERNDYREKMRNAATSKERQAVRDEHRKVMQDRMAEQGMHGGPASRGRGQGMGPRGGPGSHPGNGPGKPPATAPRTPDAPG
ncbi:MAG TPA: hypothetical protein VHP37_29310 [Burkholderiales bacterium]|nr:hypothetical protein [Burkholderiales bacterium]